MASLPALLRLHCQKLPWKPRYFNQSTIPKRSPCIVRSISSGKGQASDGEEGVVDSGDIGGELAPEMGFRSSVDTGDTNWGPKALKCAKKVLSSPEMLDLSLFSFRVLPSTRQLVISLDKLTDKYGSPCLEEIQEFAELFRMELEAEMGEEEAGSVEVEASSPGAEREVRIPDELERFKDLPMQVIFKGEDEVERTKILMFVDKTIMENGVIISGWRLADTRAGRAARKGKPLRRKDRKLIIQIPLTRLKQVNLYLDV